MKVAQATCRLCGAALVPSREPSPWARPDPDGLTEAITKAAAKPFPVMFSEISREVAADYGSCHERMIYRYLSKLVREHKTVVRLDVKLARAAYISPTSKMLKDPPSIREYLLGKFDVYEHHRKP